MMCTLLSGHGREAIELSKMQETTAQLEHQRQIKEIEAQVEQMKIKQIQIAQEEHRKTIEEQGRVAKQRAEYEDQLARRRCVCSHFESHRDFRVLLCFHSHGSVTSNSF